MTKSTGKGRGAPGRPRRWLKPKVTPERGTAAWWRYRYLRYVCRLPQPIARAEADAYVPRRLR